MMNIFVRTFASTADYSPIANIVNWVLVVAIVLSVCSKVAIRYLTTSRLNVDDGILTLAMVFFDPQQSHQALLTRNAAPERRSICRIFFTSYAWPWTEGRVLWASRE